MVLVKPKVKVEMQPPEVVYKKGVLENFAKFIRKHLSQSLFYIETKTPTQVFP